MLFFGSVLVDRYLTGAHLLEDGVKLLAIVTWSAFLLDSAVHVVRDRTGSPVVA